MVTLATGGRITEAIVDAEISRLHGAYSGFDENSLDANVDLRIFSRPKTGSIGFIDQLQLVEVIKVGSKFRSLAEAGQRLFNAGHNKNPVSMILIT